MDSEMTHLRKLFIENASKNENERLYVKFGENGQMPFSKKKNLAFYQIS